MRDFTTFMRDSGLSMPQVSALFRLRYQGMCGVSDIADHLDVTSAAASQMVDRLVQQGLLERSTDPNDRRVKRIQLTPLGHRLLDDAVEARVQWLAGLTTVLTPEQQQKIVEALDVLTDAATQLEAQMDEKAVTPRPAPLPS
jgi:DNA-binding MarR family transcriptional regulator